MAAAAQASAATYARLHALAVVPRRTHLVKGVQLDDAGIVGIDVGTTVALRWDRYGFDIEAGTPRLVIGIESNLRDRVADITLWGE